MGNSDLQSLLDDGRTARALAAILARAESGDGTVNWESVSDTVPAEVWGRIVGSDVLVPVGESFVIDDPPAVREALEGADIDVSEDATVEEPEPLPGWRSVDKAAGAGALSLMAGYQISPIKEAVASGMHVVLGPVAGVVPFWVLVALLAVTVAVISTGIRRRLVDEEGVSTRKARTNQVRERLREAKERGDQAAVERLRGRRDELMHSQLGMLVHMLRPMAWSMLVTIPIFLWISWVVVTPQFAIAATTPALPVLGRMAWSARVLGPMRLWMVYYVGNVVVSNLVVKRVTRRLSSAPSSA